MNTVKRRKKQHAARKWKATLRELRNFASITEAALLTKHLAKYTSVT